MWVRNTVMLISHFSVYGVVKRSLFLNSAFIYFYFYVCVCFKFRQFIWFFSLVFSNLLVICC